MIFLPARQVPLPWPLHTRHICITPSPRQTSAHWSCPSCYRHVATPPAGVVATTHAGPHALTSRSDPSPSSTLCGKVAAGPGFKPLWDVKILAVFVGTQARGWNPGGGRGWWLMGLADVCCLPSASSSHGWRWHRSSANRGHNTYASSCCCWHGPATDGQHPPPAYWRACPLADPRWRNSLADTGKWESLAELLWCPSPERGRGISSGGGDRDRVWWPACCRWRRRNAAAHRESSANAGWFWAGSPA